MEGGRGETEGWTQGEREREQGRERQGEGERVTKGGRNGKKIKAEMERQRSQR